MGILFILFPGFRENSFTYYSRNRFLEKLNTVGTVFCCENKIYDLTKPMDLEVSDFAPKRYLESVYSQIMKTVPHAKTLDWIPIGNSLGGYQAVGFSQIYSRKCLACFLLDPLLFTYPNMETIPFFQSILESSFSTKITKSMLQEKQPSTKYIDYLQYVYAFQLSKWTMQNITGVPFKKPVYSFINMTKPEGSNIALNSNEQPYFEPFFTNKRKRVEISILHLCTFKTPTFRCAINNSLIFVFYLTFS